MMIDTTTWRKTVYPLRHGYDRRPSGARPTSIVVHSTNGKPGTSFGAEAKYLRDSATVSAHYLVGKSGQIAEILLPNLRAWHTGDAIPAFDNSRSIGIELHHAVGEVYPQEQLDALTWLVRKLMADYEISPDQVETHRRIALPSGRKTDPSNWPDAAFYLWRSRLPLATGETPKRMMRTRCAMPILEDRRLDAPIALQGSADLYMGQVVEIDDVTGVWAHLATGIGFVPAAWLEPV